MATPYHGGFIFNETQVSYIFCVAQDQETFDAYAQENHRGLRYSGWDFTFDETKDHQYIQLNFNRPMPRGWTIAPTNGPCIIYRRDVDQNNHDVRIIDVSHSNDAENQFSYRPEVEGAVTLSNDPNAWRIIGSTGQDPPGFGLENPIR